MRFEIVEMSEWTSGTQRKPPGGVVGTTDRTRLFKESSNELDRIAAAKGLKRDEYTIGGGVGDSGSVAIYVHAPNTGKHIRVRRAKDGYLTFHLGSIFKKYPDLRPVTSVEVLASTEVDDRGESCLVLALKGGLPVRTKSRKPKAPNGKSEKTDKSDPPDQPDPVDQSDSE